MNSKRLWLIIAALFLLCSCSSELQEDTSIMPKVGDVITITAYSGDSAQTKTGIIDDGSGRRFVVWKSGNSISLFFNGGDHGGNKFTTNTNGPIAEFTGTISAVSGDLSGTGGHAYFWGLYPYNSLASCNGSAITTSLPAIQMAYQEDVADNLLVTVGRSENLSIHFKNTCAIIGFKVSQENIKRVVYSSNANEPIAGEFQVSFDSNNAIVDTPTENTVGSITIKPAESSTFEPGVMYYFAVLPGILSGGFSLTFTRADDYVATFTRESSCEIEAGLFYTLTNKDQGLTFTPAPPSPQDNITFADALVESICLENWDTSGDDALSYEEAASVDNLGDVFQYTDISSFNELQYFTGLTDLYESFNQCIYLTEITLPSGLTGIGNLAFCGCSELSEIELPSGIVSIGASAFSGCSSLTEITIPNGISFISERAFYGCTSLTEVLLPAGVTDIRNEAFMDCIALTELSIPSSVTIIRPDAFRNCSSLTEITIPSNVTVISGSAFYGCSNLTQVLFPADSQLSRIESYAFADCSSLNTITIPSNTSEIGDFAFRRCSSLTGISLPTRISAINFGTFSGCTCLEEISLPSRVTTIGVYAFQGCSSLAEITIPSRVTSIGSAAFQGCSSLAEITIPSGVTSIEDSAFNGCSSLVAITIPSGVTSIGSYAFDGCSSLTAITIPSGVTSIGSFAFARCIALEEITLPSGVTNIGNDILTSCEAFSKLTVLASEPPLVDRWLASKNMFGFIPVFSIYVPSGSVGTYKTAPIWTDYADSIFAIPE